MKQSLSHVSALKSELDQVRATAATLTQDYGKIRETSREAREDTTAAMATVKEVENKLGPLARLHELSRSTEERLTSLNALAEHVSHKGKALESQQQAVEHAVVQANRVNEMVWAMDVQIAKLNEGMKQAAKVEDTVGRIEKLTEEADAQLEAAGKTRHEAERETAKLTKDAGALLESVRGHVESVAGRKKEFEVFEERLRALQTSVVRCRGAHGGARRRRTRTSPRSRRRSPTASPSASKRCSPKPTISRRNSSRSTRSRAFVGQLDDFARKTTWQMDALQQSRQDLEALRKDIHDFHKVARRSGEAGRQARRRSRRARCVRGEDDAMS